MNFKDNEISLINEIGLNEINEEEIGKFSLNQKKNELFPEAAKKKILISLLLILLIRLGNFIQIPGIDKNIFFELTQSNSFLSFKDNSLFGSNYIPGLFYLGIGPSINASIIIQLFITINPNLKKFQKEEGEFARKKISQYTRYLTLILSIIQSYFFIFSIKSSIINWNFRTGFEICCLLTTGAMIVLWISEKITKNGIAKGSSLLVFLNVVIAIPKQIESSFENISIYQTVILIVTLIFTTSSVIVLQQSLTCLPLVTSKLLMKEDETKLYKQKTFFPVKLNQAGVMPIVFTSYLLPILKSGALLLVLKTNEFFQVTISLPKFLTESIYLLAEFILICLFTNFYSLIVIDPKDISENLQKASFFIPGIRPGKETLVFLEKLFNRQSLLGGIILATNVIFLNVISLIIKLPISQGIGIASQTIILGVMIEILQKTRSLMISEIYKKYLQSKN